MIAYLASQDSLATIQKKLLFPQANVLLENTVRKEVLKLFALKAAIVLWVHKQLFLAQLEKSKTNQPNLPHPLVWIAQKTNTVLLAAWSQPKRNPVVTASYAKQEQKQKSQQAVKAENYVQ